VRAPAVRPRTRFRAPYALLIEKLAPDTSVDELRVSFVQGRLLSTPEPLWSQTLGDRLR
jgi:hypothetical protein